MIYPNFDTQHACLVCAALLCAGRHLGRPQGEKPHPPVLTWTKNWLTCTEGRGECLMHTALALHVFLKIRFWRHFALFGSTLPPNTIVEGDSPSQTGEGRRRQACMCMAPHAAAGNCSPTLYHLQSEKKKERKESCPLA